MPAISLYLMAATKHSYSSVERVLFKAVKNQSEFFPSVLKHISSPVICQPATN